MVTPANAAIVAHDPNLVARIEAFGSVYFTGGDQSKIVSALAPGGVELRCCGPFARRRPTAASSRARAPAPP